MDTFFFWTSKLVWMLISPDSLIMLLALAAWLSLLPGWHKLSRRLLGACTLLLVSIAFLPVGEWVMMPLETRFAANPALPETIDGIIVLSGAVDAQTSNAWGQPEVAESADRLIAFASLARHYPEARLVFTGGSGSLIQQQLKEADIARDLFTQLGLGSRDIVFESDSRNTYENAINSKSLVEPQPGERWVLITSAFHMPRSVGIFCQQDWQVIAYPVDHRSTKGNLLRVELSLYGHLTGLIIAIREWVGLSAYFVTGKTSQWFPGVNSACQPRE